MVITAGGATRIINCEIGDQIKGQLEQRVCAYIHDDLEANAFFISDGREKILFIVCDLAMLGCLFVRAAAAAIAAKTGVPARQVIISCTHTHEGPDTFGLLFDVPTNEQYLRRLRDWLLEVAGEAVASARPARIGWALGRARIGYNRRVCWADGVHTMYGDTRRPGFNGIEGPDDPAHAILFALDKKDGLIFLALNNSCHATCTEMAAFASSDYPGVARAKIRSAAGSNIPVLYLQGASGDTSPWDLLHPEKKMGAGGEQRAQEIGSLLADETFRLLHQADVREDIVVSHCSELIEMAVRLPGPEKIAEAERIIAGGEKKAGREDFALQHSVLCLYEEFKAHPFEAVAVHAVRVGDFAIATNPCELYCQFGLDLKRRSPAKVTAVAQLADGWSGYCPTTPALLGGGYSADGNYGCRLEPTAGYRIVDVTAALLYRLWREQGLISPPDRAFADGLDK